MAGKSNRLSILSNAAKINLEKLPYPHIVIKDALDKDVYLQLEAEFPKDEIILNGRLAKDTWFDYPASKVISDQRISPMWREFFKYHVSQQFFKEILDLSGEQILTLNQGIEKRVGRSLGEFSVGMRPGGRGDPLASGADVSMECQFYLNYSVKPRTVRGPHVDRPSELFAALLYFRQDDDSSTGADLEICEGSNELFNSKHQVKIGKLPAEINESKITVVKKVNYAANTLVLFLNSARSIHAVSPRSPTTAPRRHINFCCDVAFDLFSIDVPFNISLRRSVEKIPGVWRFAKFLPS
jgi:hypothetical protein